MRLKTTVGWLLAFGLLTGCAGLMSNTGASAPILAPLAQPAGPEVAVTAFLDAWKTRNYEAMYTQISAESRAMYAFSVFETTYTTADTATGMSDLTYTLRDTQLQGSTAAVIYDLNITSATFGTIADPNRTMRLINSPQGWRVAWSSMDIFDGLAAGTQIRPVVRREPRANIYDRNGNAVVEQGGTVVALYVRRDTLANEAACLDLLATLLRRQRQDIADYFGEFLPDSRFYVGEVDADVYASRAGDLLATCSIADVNTIERQTRRYYRGNAVSHVVGHIGQIPADNLQTWLDRGYETGELIGLDGVELAFEAQLSGQADRILRITEPGGIAVRELGSSEGTAPQPVTLTIDRELQAEVAQALADAYNYAEPNWGGRGISTGAAAIVLDVNTGAILAMSSFPLYEPDIFNPDTACCGIVAAPTRIGELFGDPRTPMFNRVTQGQFSPGSIFKIVTTAAVAQEKLFDPNEIFYCGLDWTDGPLYGDTAGFIRGDWRKWEPEPFNVPTGDITLSQALTSSCDPFFYQMGAQLFTERGPSTLMDYARRMGLGTPTGINYFGPEAIGQVPVPRSVSDAINTAIGQGDVQVTPIQMARLTAAIANGGTVYQPYLVQQVGGVDGTDVSFTAQPVVVGELGLDAEALAIVRQGMCDVTKVEDLGTAVWPFEGTAYHACAKTGTSQTSRYPNAWFVSYVPAENPQIAVVVMAEQSLEGSQVAAPITRRIMDFYLGQPWPGYPPFWSEGPYVPLNTPQGSSGGG